jgi:hypothetical protein
MQKVIVKRRACGHGGANDLRGDLLDAEADHVVARGE